METMMSKIEEQLGATLSAGSHQLCLVQPELTAGKPASMSLVEAVTVAKVRRVD